MDIQCIYCAKIKDQKDYNVEHVLPESFGKFNNNYTLNGVVCWECNQLFGDTIDLYLARDTYEGIIRYTHNMKNSENFKNMGKNSRLKIKLCEGEFKGSYAYIDNIDGVLKIYPVKNQVALFNSELNEFEYFLIDNLFEKSELPEKYKHDGKIKIVLLEASFEYMKNAIAEKGYDEFIIEGEIISKNIGTNDILCEHEREIDLNLSRAVSKIAFNYYTYTMGSDFSRLNCFDNIRNFIYKGLGETKDFISLSYDNMLNIEESKDEKVLAHIVTLEWNKNYNEIIATVSLFNTIQYKIVLTNTNFITPKKVDFGSLYNIGDMCIYPIEKKTSKYHELLKILIK